MISAVESGGMKSPFSFLDWDRTQACTLDPIPFIPLFHSYPPGLCSRHHFQSSPPFSMDFNKKIIAALKHFLSIFSCPI